MHVLGQRCPQAVWVGLGGFGETQERAARLASSPVSGTTLPAFDRAAIFTLIPDGRYRQARGETAARSSAGWNSWERDGGRGDELSVVDGGREGRVRRSVLVLGSQADDQQILDRSDCGRFGREG